MINALSSHQLGLLNECRAVAIENSRFYEKAYNAATDDHDKSLIGSAAAQRKVFVEAMSAILSVAENTPSKPCHNRPQGLVLELPDSLSVTHNDDFKTMAAKHEQQFDASVKMALNCISDDTTQEVLNHHLMAAQIATRALVSADIINAEID